MKSVKMLLLLGAMTLAACQPTEPALGPDGKPLPQVYKITSKEAEIIPVRVQESMNSLRAVRGTAPVALNPQLNAAAQAHAQDMAQQNRAWHWGSDGSSMLDRGRRAGYPGHVIGENISETYETEIETLSAWMSVVDTRDVILNPAATQMGFGWYQEPSGKIWWTMVTGN